MHKIQMYAGLLLILLLAGCSPQNVTAPQDETLRIVASAYPSYDFARQVAGDRAVLSMLTRPGIDPHEYEPTPQNIIDIQNCDVFIYNGGESDIWVDEILQSVDNPDMQIIRMMDCVTLLEEETVEGMEAEDTHTHAEEDAEYDEHVWLSPPNVIQIAGTICDVLTEVDPEGESVYVDNTDQFINDLETLDACFREIVANAERTTVVFADRFPARYFTEEYGLTYYAAFPGCSSQTEPSAATVAFLIDKVKDENIPCVFSVPYSRSSLTQTISEATGAAIRSFNSFHNVGDQEFGQVTNIDVMYENAEALEFALN